VTSRSKTIAALKLCVLDGNGYAHVLNLVLSKSSNSIKNSRIFFSNLSGFASFFYSYKAIIFLPSRVFSLTLPPLFTD
jgi:hypothetical protein